MKDLLRASVRAAETQPLSPFALADLANDLGYSYDIARMAEMILLEDGWLTRNERGHLVPSRKLRLYRATGWDADLERWRRELKAHRNNTKEDEDSYFGSR